VDGVARWLPKHLKNKGLKFENLSMLVIPWHIDTEGHWSLLRVDMQARVITVFDPLGPGDRKMPLHLLNLYMKGTNPRSPLYIMMSLGAHQSACIS
jgi:hypothetical protein